MMDLFILVVALVVTYITGTQIEKKHFRSVLRRERERLAVPLTSENFTALDGRKILHVKFVSGSCVVGADFFKVWVSGLKSIFGGKLTAYESLLDRARREAMIRMKDQAGGSADMIVQMRLETSEIGKGIVEIVAYGTAVYLDKRA